MHTWHVVSNSEGTILAVYGSALLSEAEAKIRSLTREWATAFYLHNIVGNRPRVYEHISMHGNPVRFE